MGFQRVRKRSCNHLTRESGGSNQNPSNWIRPNPNPTRNQPDTLTRFSSNQKFLSNQHKPAFSFLSLFLSLSIYPLLLLPSPPPPLSLHSITSILSLSCNVSIRRFKLRIRHRLQFPPSHFPVNSAQFGSIQLNSAQFGSIRLDLARFRLAGFTGWQMNLKCRYNHQSVQSGRISWQTHRLSHWWPFEDLPIISN